MTEKSISYVQGNASLAHNNREFFTENIDRERTPDNITIIKQPLKEAYEHCFGQAVAEYNSIQTRNDRKISDYFQHVFRQGYTNSRIHGGNNQYSFYETLVQVGNKDDTAVGTADAETAKKILIRYAEEFQERNPNFYMFNAVIHLDEKTPHLHLDYIPIGHYNRGIPVQNGHAQALKEMGYGTGKDAVNVWRESEKKYIERLCLEHGISKAPPKENSWPHMNIAEFKEPKDELNALKAEKEALSDELEHKNEEITEMQKTFEELSNTRSELNSVDDVEMKETLIGGKVTMTKDAAKKLRHDAKIGIASSKKYKALTKEVKELKEQNTALLAENEEFRSREAKRGCISIKDVMKDDRHQKELTRLQMLIELLEYFIDFYGLRDKFMLFKKQHEHSVNHSRNNGYEHI